MRFFIELSYNGSAYHGWQNQPNAITVQEVLEKALSTLLNENIAIVGAGRTDTGVHARQMFAHFDTAVKFVSEALVVKLNAFLPKDISIRNISEVNADVHARFDAKSRTYMYKVSCAKNPFSFDYSYYLKNKLDIEKMNEAAKILFDYTNFKCFSRSNSDVKTYNCDIMLAKWSAENDQLIFMIRADRFLRNMVRAIVGTMIEIGLNKMNLDQFRAIIESEDRSNAGPSAPAHALYLEDIEYDNTIYINE
ncbi:MAG: tRNA pseudouridine(38-40) synthase TruA [Bacteroidia bacterium]|nr:tRNA pseudouridine(38-40) synthase TruA [Bacteroidia bacterium]NND53325.1 tRNA pseudouridine(38-40) synthase TruA [Flavobacteriaceae bacterium]